MSIKLNMQDFDREKKNSQNNSAVANIRSLITFFLSHLHKHGYSSHDPEPRN
jgi:hypothetical protein